MELQKQNMELATKSFETNVALIEDKVGKATAALSELVKVDSEDDDEKARVLLTRVRATFTAVQGMRKEITDPLDAIKSELMDFEKKISTAKGSNSDYQRVKLLRDAFANKKAAEAKAEAERIQMEKDKKIEIADVKLKLKSSVELGVFDLIRKGEIALTNFVNGMTLDNFEEKLEKMNHKPKLKKEAFDKLLQVPYNEELIPKSEYMELANKFADYDKVNEVYVEQSIKHIDKFKNDVIPKHKINLEERSKLDEAEQIRQKEIADQKAKEHLDEVNSKYEAEKQAAIEEAADKAAESKIDAEFEAQVSVQSIKEQSGIRTNISYKLSPEALKKPSALIETLTKVMTHVMINENFQGIVKRDAQKFPKTDDKGNQIMVDGISFWLKELAKLKIDADSAKIPNLEKIEDITTIAKS